MMPSVYSYGKSSANFSINFSFIQPPFATCYICHIDIMGDRDPAPSVAARPNPPRLLHRHLGPVYTEPATNSLKEPLTIEPLASLIKEFISLLPKVLQR